MAFQSETNKQEDKPIPDFRLIQTFSKCQRIVASKFYLKGKTIEEVSKEMNLSKSFISYQIARVKKKLHLRRYDYFHKKTMGDLYKILLRDFKIWERLQETPEEIEEQEEN